jgi:malonyl-CoA/methylmalonyl-CoA synthetase
MSHASPLLARWQSTLGTRVGVIDAAGEHTFAALDAGARAVAAALLADRRSLAGERIGVLVRPEAGFVEALFGVLHAGGAAVVLSPLHPAPELAFFCEDARIRTIIASPELLEPVSAVTTGRQVLPIDLARLHPVRQVEAASAADAALHLYTSGSTGKPKGVVLSHANLAEQQALLAEAWDLSAADVLLHTLPLHHVHGLSIALLSVLGAAGTVRLLPQFEARAVWDAMSSSTVFMAVPTIYTKLLAAFESADPKTQLHWQGGARQLRVATSGSAALPATLGERWRAITGLYPLERYGMTEIGVALSNPLHGERRPGGVGKPLTTVRTRIVADDGVDADSGELWVAGPSVFSGYFCRDEATSAAFVEQAGERWFRTGDTVQRDEDGYFRILGRTSVDILKSGGYKLSALEIEEALREHPSVSEVAVVGLPDDTWGERVVACVVVHASTAAEGLDERCFEEELRAFARERIAVYKIPKRVFVMQRLPRNAMGKVVKPELVANLRQTLSAE